MISRDKVLEILKGLQQKVAHRQVRWNTHDTRGRVTEFWVTFPSSWLYLRYDSPPTDFDAVEVEIRNEDDLVVASARIDEEDPEWAWAKDLYDEVERQVLGSDRILEEIENAIRSGGEIGQLI